MTVKISDIAISIKVDPLSKTPGNVIQAIHGGSRTGMNSKLQADRAGSVYKKFIEKDVPLLIQHINMLIGNRCITQVHLPFHLDRIFFNFIDELIEHYQNQCEYKDSEVAKTWKEWQDIKLFLLKMEVNYWSMDDHKKLNTLFKKLEEKLEVKEAFPREFKKAISEWNTILRIPFAGRACLASLFLESKKDRKKIIKEDEEYSTLLSQPNTELAFFFALKHLQKDASWMLPEILKGALPIDPKLESKLKLCLKDVNSSYSSLSISELIHLDVQRMKSTIENIRLISIDNLTQVQASFLEVDAILANVIFKFPIYKANNWEFILETGTTLESKDGTRLTVTEEMLPHLINYEKAYYLQKYLNLSFSTLWDLLQSLCKAQYALIDYKTKGVLPLLASDIEPLLPVYDPSAAQKLRDEESEEKKEQESVPLPQNKKDPLTQNRSKKSEKNNQGKTKANDNSKKNNPPKANQSVKNKPSSSKNRRLPPSQNLCPSPMTTSTVKTAVNAIVPIEQQDSIFKLKKKLLDLYLCQEKPCYVLGQALWHLDALMSFRYALMISRCSVPKTPTSAECLSLSNAVAYCSQKVLEQTYRFRTKKEDGSFHKIHNLKEYHLELNPNAKTYPKVVNDLFLANNWCRYFYFDHYHWSRTSAIPKTPSILNSLFHMAEGQILSLEKLKKFIDLTIEDVCQQVEELLQDEKAPNSPSKVIQYNALELKETLSPDLFDKVSQQIENLLKSSNYNIHYPRLVHLSMKQALAAFSMLKVGLQKMNEAKDVRVFSTWTVCCLQQLQESMENVLHAIAYCENQEEEISIEHEIKTLAGDLNLDIGTLGDEFEQLSYAMRYPVEYRAIKTKPMEIVGDLQNFIESPDLMEGFQSNQTSPLVWTQPSKGLSELREKNIELTQNLVIGELIVNKFASLLDDCVKFLTFKALPLLEQNLLLQGAN